MNLYIPTEILTTVQRATSAAELSRPGQLTINRNTSAVNAARLKGDILSRTSSASRHNRVRRILVVDDNQDAANVLSELLQILGYDVTAVFHPNAALALSEAQKFDAFLLDIGLPSMDGHELAKQLRAKATAGDALYVAVTGYNNVDDRRRSAAAGFDFHFGKPVNVGALVDALGPPNNSPSESGLN